MERTVCERDAPSRMGQDAPPSSGVFYPIPGKAGHSLAFDLRSDPGEHVDLSATFPEKALLWKELNSSVRRKGLLGRWSAWGYHPGPSI